MSHPEQPNLGSQVKRQTLGDRINGTHKARHETTEASQHLNNAQKNAVNEWLVQSSKMATPSHPRDLHAHVLDLTGKIPGTNWPYRYLKENSDILKISKPQHLDPKRVKIGLVQTGTSNARTLRNTVLVYTSDHIYSRPRLSQSP